ncbi:MAG: adenosylmethionine--8-amino-7-oxononanoate transaminase [Gammaproteobacteria bacterium]|nr:adenosylmethionine--8-amino-7-oxononanoate transaminase [Gammaproteobacteria bacterium]
MNKNSDIPQDAQFIWHPCSQMKDHELYKPLVIERAYGSYLELSNGEIIIDAISSWWCKSLGHNHPILKNALLKQLDCFEHIDLANTTNHLITRLSEKLSQLMPHLSKVFYASDGSSAVEIALKMSLHARVNEGNFKKTHFIALKNAYHGETLGALSVSDLGIYRAPYQSALLKTPFIEPAYVANTDDPIWNDAHSFWIETEKSLEHYCDTATALIIEPIVQGAAGMKIISKDFLEKLAVWAKAHDIHIIADEIMTGIGRTGKMLACDHTNIQPDFVCVSKGLTSGWLPFSAVITTDTIYNYFYDDYETGKAFLHSHTYSGNALAASVALATLEVIKEQALCERANYLQKIMMKDFQDIADQTGKLKNLRGIGAIVAADLIEEKNIPRQGFKIFQEAIKRGALLRPLGNTLYWFPPLNIDEKILHELKLITLEAIQSVTA